MSDDSVTIKTLVVLTLISPILRYLSWLLILTDTWLKSNIYGRELFSAKYVVYRCDRSTLNSQLNRGGVLVAVKSKFSCRLVVLPECDNLEFIVVRIVINSIIIFTFCIYVPYGSLKITYDNALKAINVFFDKIRNSDVDLVLIICDFNISNCP